MFSRKAERDQLIEKFFDAHRNKIATGLWQPAHEELTGCNVVGHVAIDYFAVSLPDFLASLHSRGIRLPEGADLETWLDAVSGRPDPHKAN